MRLAKYSLPAVLLAVVFSLVAASPLAASLTASPALPAVGQPVSFVLVPQYPDYDTSRPIAWNFGDGSIASTAGTVLQTTHAYAISGTFTASATYWFQPIIGGGHDVTETVSITVASPNRLITFSPVSPIVGQAVAFQAVNFLTPSAIAWNFGDGTTISPAGAVQTHVYNTAGLYTVQAFDQGGTAAPVTVSVTVVDNRKVTFAPAAPNVGQPVSFQASGFAAPNALAWDFGDGTSVASGGSFQSHVFNSAGNFSVKVRDAGSATSFVTAIVPVVNRRIIQAVPATGLKTGQAVQFQASGFIDPCILWNFGDGTNPVQGLASQSHVFAKPGTFAVTAKDKCGHSTWTAALSLFVAPAEGPLAGFDLTFALLRFENGQTSIIVPQGTTGLAAFADVKYEGTGTILVEWRVDGQPWRTDSAGATFGGALTLNSGHVPGLPTAVPGPHTVELRFLQPATSFTLSPISYTVSASKADLKPVVEKAVPADFEAGREHEVTLEGKNLVSGTAFGFGSDIGIVGGPLYGPGGKASLKIFVAPTAKVGERAVRAGNIHGSSVGPGTISVSPAVLEKQIPPDICVKLSEIPEFPIMLKAPEWWGTVYSDWHMEGTPPSLVPGSSEIKVNVPTVDDTTLLQWDLPYNFYDYVEVRFFKPKTKDLLTTVKLSGSAESLRLSGDILAQIFKGYTQSLPGLNPVISGGTKVSVQNPRRFGYGAAVEIFQGPAPGGGTSALSFPNSISTAAFQDPPSSTSESQLFAQGLADGATLAWQVAAFKVYPCVLDNTPKALPNQPVQEAVSEIWLLGLPSGFTGIACPSSGSQFGTSIQAVNFSAQVRDQKSGNEGVTGTANFVGDAIILEGEFSLAKSPYAAHIAQGSPVKIPNLFIDWGDGTPAVPVWGKIVGGGSWSKSSKIALVGGFLTGHAYAAEGAHTVRIFQLAEDDIQEPQSGFYAALADAVTPDPPGQSSYGEILDLIGGPAAQGPAASDAAAISGTLARAYMIFCKTILISSYADTCASGPLHLVSLELVNFPGHDIIKKGSSAPQEGGVTIRDDLIPSYSGIYAVALECDKALFARARLRYYGTGAIQVDWAVDGQWVQTKTISPLNSAPRKNLASSAAADCKQALVSELILDSDTFPVQPLGKHPVFVRVMVVPDYAQVNLSGLAGQAVRSLAFQGPKLSDPSPGASGRGPLLRTTGESAGADPFAAMLAIGLASGQSVPQIGFLSPGLETGGGPAVVYLNDALDPSSAKQSLEGPWVPENDLTSETCLRSETKNYIVNEVGDTRFCQIRVPTSGGEFLISDFGSSLQRNGLVYDGVGTLIYRVRTGGGSVDEAYLPGVSFKDWSIEETSGLLQNGILEAAASAGSMLSFPANIEGAARSFKTQVNGTILTPMAAAFNLTLKAKQGVFLRLAEGAAAGNPPAWTSVEGALTSEGDWMATGSPLPLTSIGLTGFLISSSSVTFDFSVLAAGSGAAEGPGWTGVLLGNAIITPETFGLTGSAPLTMTNEKPWRLTAGGLSGHQKSGSFSAKVEEATIAFHHLDFQVAFDTPVTTYVQCAIAVPWIGAVLKGDAQLVKTGNSSGEYGMNWAGLKADPVHLAYQDKGRVLLDITGLTWGRDSRGWRARGQAAVILEAEGKPFAQFALNGLNFGTDARAYFDGPVWGATVPLAGSAGFGGATATLQSVQVESASAGADRLAFHVAAEISISPDSSFIPSSAVVLHYGITRAGANFLGTGPANSPFSTNVVFPLGSQEVSSTVSPNYEYAGSSPDPEASGGTAGPSAWGGANIPDCRFGGNIDLAMFGCAAVKGTFLLGYQSGKSFFFLFAKYDNLVLPMSPIPLCIFGIGGGFAYNFPDQAFRLGDMSEAQPDLKGHAVFAAVMTVGTSDRNTIMGDGYIILSTQGSAQLGFDHLRFLQQGDFGGFIRYENKIISGKSFGELDLIGGLINFSLGSEADPAVAFQFGGGEYWVRAGQKNGQRITAKIWKAKADSYLEIDSQGIRVGGRSEFGGEADVKIARAYVKSSIDIGFELTFDPLTIGGNFDQDIAAGGCLWAVIKDICLEIKIWSQLYGHAPDPTVLRASFGIDFGIKTVSFTVDLI